MQKIGTPDGLLGFLDDFFEKNHFFDDFLDPPKTTLTKKRENFWPAAALASGGSARPKS